MPILLTEKHLASLYGAPAAMDPLLNLIEDALRAHGSGRVAGEARFDTTLSDQKKKIRVSAAAVPGAGAAMRVNALFRAADGHFILLFDGERGDLLALIDGRELNVWRTGAPAGVAARHLAPPEPRSLAIVGSGRQARGQLLALSRALPDLQRVRVFSPTRDHRERYAREMSEWLQIDIDAVESAEVAVNGAPIVGLATSSRSAIVEREWIVPGALVISITSGQMPEPLVAGARVFVSWKEELLNGEPPRQPYAAMVAAGNWSAEKIAGELSEVILGATPARLDQNEIVVFEAMGMHAWDTVAAAWAYRWGVENKAGSVFNLAD